MMRAWLFTLVLIMPGCLSSDESEIDQKNQGQCQNNDPNCVPDPCDRVRSPDRRCLRDRGV